MLPLSLDQSVRPLAESPVFVGPNEGNAPTGNDTFDSHLGRPSDAQGPQSTPPENVTRDESSDDEPERDEPTTVAAANCPVPPTASSSAEITEESESATESTDPEAIANIENTSHSENNRADSSLAESQEKLLELKAKIANQSLKAKADKNPIELEADDAAQALDSAEGSTGDALPDAPSELAVSELIEVELTKTVDVSQLVAANEPAQVSIKGEAAIVSESFPGIPGVEIEEESTRKNINTGPSKSDARKSKISHPELSSSSNSDPTPPPRLSAAAVAEFGNRLRDSSDSAVADHRDAAAINTAATSMDREPGAPNNSATQRLVQHLSGGSEERVSKANALGGADQARFVDRVARAFRAAENRQGVVKLRLHPPELGSLRIELRMQNGALTAKLEAETAMTQSLLIEHAYALRDRLSEQGVRIERFDVDLADRRSMDHPGTFQERSQQERDPPNHLQRDPQPAPQTNTRPVPLSLSPAAPGKINVIV